MVIHEKLRFLRHTNINGTGIDIEVILPSGSSLYYRRVQIYQSIKTFEGGHQKEVDDITYLNPNKGRVSLWGGTLFGHIISAIARDILGEGLIALENAGYKTLGTIHDEVWVICPKQILKSLPSPKIMCDGEDVTGDTWSKITNLPASLWGEKEIGDDILKKLTAVPEWAKGLKGLGADLVVNRRYAK